MRKVKLHDGEHYGVTDVMGGKMKGMWSLNTSPTANAFCLKMRENPNLICSHCYSHISEARWKNCRAAWTNNFQILTSRVLQDNELAKITKVDLFRFQAHGDLGSREHYVNLVRIADANPTVRFALWTKNLAVINDGGIIIRDNLVHVYSTPKLNELNPYLPKGFDKVFTVYSRPFLREHPEVAINCAQSCMECQLCYEKNDVSIINERIKAPASRD